MKRGIVQAACFLFSAGSLFFLTLLILKGEHLLLAGSAVSLILYGIIQLIDHLSRTESLGIAGGEPSFLLIILFIPAVLYPEHATLLFFISAIILYLLFGKYINHGGALFTGAIMHSFLAAMILITGSAFGIMTSFTFITGPRTIGIFLLIPCVLLMLALLLFRERISTANTGACLLPAVSGRILRITQTFIRGFAYAALVYINGIILPPPSFSNSDDDHMLFIVFFPAFVFTGGAVSSLYGFELYTAALTALISYASVIIRKRMAAHAHSPRTFIHETRKRYS